MKKPIAISVVALLFTLCVTKLYASQYSITDLGALQNDPLNNSYAHGINDHGQIVGHSNYRGLIPPYTSYAINHAFLYQNGSMTDLGLLGSPLSSSSAVGINNNGQIVGWYDGVTDRQAFFYENGTMAQLTPNIEYYSYATAINDTGDIVGTIEVAEGVGNRPHAFLYSDGTLHDLGRGAGVDINNSGIVLTPQYYYDDGVKVYFQGFNAIGMNDVNSIAGNTYHGTACLYRNDLFIEIDPLSGDVTNHAHAINELDQIVGWSRGGSGDRAYLYSQEQGALDLYDLIEPGHQWSSLQVATDINDNGQIIGVGMINGSQHGFLLNPISSPVPAPGTIYLLSIGLIGLAGITRKKHTNYKSRQDS